MPFALSGAITAGVAPLLFVQILYRQQFYSANLLLSWRWMVVTLEQPVRTSMLDSIGMPWLLILISGVLFQIVGWTIQFRRPCICNRWLTAINLASTILLLGAASLREIIRLTQANLDQVTAATKAAAAVGGFELFVIFTLLNVGLIVWCVRMVRSSGQ